MNVNVVSPTGEIGNVPQEQLPQAIKYGYRVATQEEVGHETLKQEYGKGFGNELTAGVEGVLSGATFGGSRHIENALGITTPEAQAARKEFNPLASGAGEAAGILGSLAVVPGGGLPGLLGKGATKVGGNLAVRVLEEGAAQSFAAKAIGGTLEGLGYGASAPISETALGDPTLTAQKAFSQIGIGGLLGGAIGATTSALGLGTRRLIPKEAGREAQDIINGTSTLEGEGLTKATGPIKMEGTIDFGVPDKKILKQAESLNPKNPLKQNDLNFIKQETPAIFQKIGTPEVPTLDPMAIDQVYMGDSVKEGMKALQAERTRLNQAADDALSTTLMPNGKPLSMTKNSYVKLFDDVIDNIKESSEYGLPIGKRAIGSLEKWAEAGQDMPKEIPATTLRDILQNIRDEGRIYVKGGGLKEDFVSKSLNKVQKNLDDFLKDNSQEYKKIQEEFSPFTKNNIELEDHLNWNWQRNDSDLVLSDWVTNRIAKPFQSTLPGTKANADLIRWFGKYAGVDFEKASKANFIYGKLNPQSAQAGQLGSWGARLVEGMEMLKRPTELPGKAISGTAKMVLTGEMPEFITQMRAKGVQDLLLGKTTNPSAVDSILSKISKGSKLLEGPLGSFMVPAGVKLHQFIQESDSMDHADRKLEVLQALQNAQKKADHQINTAVKGIFSDKPSKMDASKDEFLSQSPEELADSIQEVRDQANELMNMPERLLERLDQANRGMDSVPNVLTNLNMTAVRALQLISQQMQSSMPEGEKLLFDAKFVPSKTQLSSLTKTMKYIHQPWEVLKEVSTGRVSKEGKTVLEQVYPELYNDMKAQIMNGISDMQVNGKTVPMAKRLSMSYFLGQPLDSGMLPQNIQRTQAVFLMPQATSQQPNPTATNSKNLKMSENMMTPLQKVASR